jgi:hypothetical protein
LSKPSEKLVLVWDVDDVLNSLTRSWFEAAWKPHHANCLVEYKQLTENPPHILLGISQEVYLASLDEFRLCGAYGMLVPEPGVMSWFQEHGHKFRNMALTATPRRAASVSSEWVMRHFGDWIRTFCFVPSVRPGVALPVYDGSKAEFLAWLGQGDVLVDDSPRNVEAAESMGLRAVLVPQPWNTSKETLSQSLNRVIGTMQERVYRD